MGDFIVIAVIAVICFFVIRSMVKKRKSGSCSCGCSECAKKDLCHPKKKD
ncbi:MAG: FeoB-associated Cys-rich membrane protein [Clostridia bacterium]|nr:FeoB-associated Cys-rich membrane protein [Clostridia bacterium]